MYIIFKKIYTVYHNEINNNSYHNEINKLRIKKLIKKIIKIGTNIARSLSSMPPNFLNPETYAEILKILSKNFNWKYDEWTADELLEMGFLAFFVFSPRILSRLL